MQIKTICYAGALCMLLAACQPRVEYALDGPTVGAQDFSVIEGDWVGTLTYTDYGSGELTEIATRSTVTSVSDTNIEYTISYPDEPWENSRSTISLSEDGRLIDGHVISDRVTDEEGTLIVTTDHRGEDDNRQADIRQTYSISPTNFYIRKSVRFNANEAFLVRNIYEYERLEND